MDTTVLIIGGLVILLIALIVLLFIVRRQRWAGSTDEPRILMGNIPAPTSREPEAELNYTGNFRPYKAGKHGHPALLTVKLEFKIPGEFNLVRESSFDRFCKRIGLVQEIKTGDRGFDELIYIQTDHPEFIRTYLADRDRRQAIRELFEKGFTQIEHNGTHLLASWLHYPHGEDGCEQDAHDAAEQLAPLTRNIPAASATRSRRRVLSRQSLQWVGGLGVGLGIALGVGLGFAMSANAFPLDHWSLIFSSLGVAVILLLVHCWFSAWLVRGHSTSHLQFFSLLMAGLFVYPPLCLLGAERLNQWLDTSPTEEHVETVTGRREQKNKNSRSYYLQFPYWDDRSRTLELGVNSSVYGRLLLGQSKVVVKTRSGSLGFHWIESFTVQDPKP